MDANSQIILNEESFIVTPSGQMSNNPHINPQSTIQMLSPVATEPI
jgi:hypothetical protein